MHLSFHGAAGGVTGSKHLLDTGRQKLLVDCGMFQGLKELRRRNWNPPPFDLATLDAILLTHAHLDHSGWLPRLARLGLQAPVHCTEATAELAELILLDAAHLQEEDAAWAKKKGYSRHAEPEPLYTTNDALRALKLLRPHPYGRWLDLGEGASARFHNAGHILGAGFVEVKVGARTVLFSGDLGRYDVPLHVDPEARVECDTLVIESTYGDRLHTETSVRDQIQRAFAETIRRRGVVLIPAFAVGRVQQLTIILRELMDAGDLPEVPIVIDSPMAVDATAIYSRHLHDHSLDRDLVFPRDVRYCRTVHDSKQLNLQDGPLVIISSSGMMTGGRILHHLTRRLGNPANLILLAGYQAVGTRGRALQDGARTLRIHGEEWPVTCRVESVDGLSSHGDWEDLLRWVGTTAGMPRRAFVVHGELQQSQKFAVRLQAKTGAKVLVPQLDERVEI
jgi:metallo-beta-lactamase family protein